MAWSWSHTAEAYQNVRDNIAAMDRKWLEVCFAEWKAAGRGGHFPPDGFSTEPFEDRPYRRALSAAKYMVTEELAERVWELAERQAICTNGGWQAWCCPYGCHEVSFSPNNEDEKDDD